MRADSRVHITTSPNKVLSMPWQMFQLLPTATDSR